MPEKAPPEVQDYLAKLPANQRRTVADLRHAILRAGPSLTQSISPWGYLALSTSKKKYAFTLIPHKEHVNLQIFNGAKLASKLPDLEGSGKSLRHLKFRYDAAVDVALVGRALRLSLAA